MTDIQFKDTDQYIFVRRVIISMLDIKPEVQHFESLDKILQCDYVNDCSRAMLSSIPLVFIVNFLFNFDLGAV